MVLFNAVFFENDVIVICATNGKFGGAIQTGSLPVSLSLTWYIATSLMPRMKNIGVAKCYGNNQL